MNTESVKHFKDRFNRVVESHGADSEHATHAFFLLQAAMMGMPSPEMFEWARKEVERMKGIALDQV